MKHPKFIVQIALESYTRYRHKYQTWWNRFNISEKEFNNNTFKIDVKSVVFWEFLAIKCFLKMPNYMIKLIIVKSRKKKDVEDGHITFFWAPSIYKFLFKWSVWSKRFKISTVFKICWFPRNTWISVATQETIKASQHSTNIISKIKQKPQDDIV